MKRLLFLGAAFTQLAPIKYALDQGFYVITCDNKPDNPGHKLAHESHFISTIDKEKVLELARSKRVDGVVAYVSDIAASTVAYVAEMIGLPGNPYESVLTLTKKDKFRKFLKEHGFNAPLSNTFSSVDEGREWLYQLKLPVYVKPVDSSGGRGITVLQTYSGFDEAFSHALDYSQERKVVIEESIPKKVGYQNDSDVFMLDGEIRFWIWGNSHFDYDCSPPFQASTSFPKTLTEEQSDKAYFELQRLLGLLKFRVGAFNVEFIIDENNEIWFLEVGPRNGGDKFGETIALSTGVDLIKYTVDAAIGKDCSALSCKPAVGFWAQHSVHSLATGKFEEISISSELKKNIYEKEIWVKKGDLVNKATGANDSLGILLLKFESEVEMLNMLDSINNHLLVKVEPIPCDHDTESGEVHWPAA